MMKYRSGFTLIEMSVVLVILALAASGGLAIFSQSKDIENMRITKERMAHIIRMTELYVLRYGHLPCPASPTTPAVPGALTLGQTAGISGTCSTTHNLLNTNGTTNVFMGAVPVAALGLDYSYFTDGWGRRFAYVVDENLTINPMGTADIIIQDAAGVSVLGHGATTAEVAAGYTSCAGTVRAAAAGTLNECVRDYAAFVVISYGKNGFGAIPYKTGLSTLAAKLNDSRNSATNTRTMENDNTHYDDSPTAPSPAFDAVFRNLPLREVAGGTPTNADEQLFDDILIWRTKSDLENVVNQ